nr:HEAT repeat domain-containing protein [Nitrosomonas nitrosa]
MAAAATSVTLTPRMRRVLALDGPTFGRPRPTPSEMDNIRQVLTAGVQAAKRLHLGRAMSIAADNVPTAETAHLIAKTLRDPAATGALRLHAAATLGDIPVQVSSDALVEALGTAAPDLEATVLTALSKVGDARAAQAIRERPTTPSRQLAHLRNFARAMILMRTGAPLDEHADAAITLRTQELKFTLASADELKATIRTFRGATYGLSFNATMGLHFECGGLRHFILLSDELQRGKLISALTARQRIAGIIAAQDERGSKTYVAWRLILTRPGSSVIDVVVMSPAGETALRGTLRPADKGYRLAINTHDQRQRAAEVRGTISKERIDIVGRLFVGEMPSKLFGEVDPAVL